MSVLIIYAALVFAVDQCSKWAVRTRLAEPLPCGRWLHLRRVPHADERYSRPAYRAVLLVIWPLALASALWLHAYTPWLQSRVAVLGAGCALGGAAGNLADILRRRIVLDFIDLGWWPVFNLADVAIVAGLALAFWR